MQSRLSHLLYGFVCVASMSLVIQSVADDQASGQKRQHGNSVMIEHAWSRESLSGQPNGAVYLDIENNGPDPVRLTSVSSDIANSARLHESRLDDGMMKMASVSSLSIAPGETVSLKPGGLHVMLMGLKEPLLVGTSHRLVCNFAGMNSIEVRVKVLAATALAFPD